MEEWRKVPKIVLLPAVYIVIVQNNFLKSHVWIVLS